MELQSLMEMDSSGAAVEANFGLADAPCTVSPRGSVVGVVVSLSSRFTSSAARRASSRHAS
eukprot:CAMPEP_0204336688 /NCGR_PEP_ID=MMETSP0469-20131031/19726_1 /ASSEMBLY_ACC=CAM_ASM_000384 /TAXON_ID=2969 /ORGANISM="Oxyrrhis marina" /LENGTH=60 /DNA_ID=CAMNT_0051320597 /DNA_START=117 /DNA_END=299 /DNA_ORIENTATION=+